MENRSGYRALNRREFTCYLQGWTDALEAARRTSSGGTQKKIRIELTKEQQDKIREATGQDAEVIELNAGELEDRISPWGPRMTM